MDVVELDFPEWDEALPSGGFDVFHTADALRVIDRHSPSDLYLLGGFRGNEAVALFPVSVQTKYGARLVTSPDLGFGIGRLGPLLMPPSPKPYKQEATNKEFVSGVLDHLDVDDRLTLLRLVCSPEYADPRPFDWLGYDVTPAFTYRLHLDETDADRLRKSFPRDLRRGIRDGNDGDFVVRQGGIDSAEQVYESIIERYREQGLRDPLSRAFVRELLETLGDDRSRVYVAESDGGEFISGMIILYSNDTAYFWKGGAKTQYDSTSPNSLLHWRVIQDILEDPDLESVTYYDLYTANNERLVRYKSKFGGSLSQYYIIESNGIAMNAAKTFYRLTAFKGGPFRLGN